MEADGSAELDSSPTVVPNGVASPLELGSPLPTEGLATPLGSGVGAMGDGGDDGTRVAVGAGVALAAGVPGGVGRGVGGGNDGVTSTVGPASGFGSAPIVADAWKTAGQDPAGSRALPL